MKRRRSLYARPAIVRGEQCTTGAFARANDGGRQRRTARLLAPLERHGWAILHDLAVPGSAANIDHLVIGPGGVFVIDSKQYRGRLQLDACRRLWHGRHPLTTALRAVSFEADRAAKVLADPPVVVPILAVHCAQVPAARSWSAACGSCRPGACPACLVPSRRCWGPNRSPPWPVRPESASALPPDSLPAAPPGGDAWPCYRTASRAEQAHRRANQPDGLLHSSAAQEADWSWPRSSTGATGGPTCDHAARSNLTGGPRAEELRSWTARRCRWRSRPSRTEAELIVGMFAVTA